MKILIDGGWYKGEVVELLPTYSATYIKGNVFLELKFLKLRLTLSIEK